MILAQYMRKYYLFKMGYVHQHDQLRCATKPDRRPNGHGELWLRENYGETSDSLVEQVTASTYQISVQQKWPLIQLRARKHIFIHDRLETRKGLATGRLALGEPNPLAE